MWLPVEQPLSRGFISSVLMKRNFFPIKGFSRHWKPCQRQTLVMPLLLHVSTAATKSLTVVHHNTEGLHCYLMTCKNTMRSAWEISCALLKHMFGSVVPDELHLEGFNMYKRNRQVSYSNYPQLANQKGGGVAIYTKTHINAQVLKYVVNVTDMEFLSLKVTDPIQTVVAAI